MTEPTQHADLVRDREVMVEVVRSASWDGDPYRTAMTRRQAEIAIEALERAGYLHCYWGGGCLCHDAVNRGWAEQSDGDGGSE